MSDEPSRPDSDTSPVFVCPSCGRTLYDRRRPDCGYCGAAMPEGLRLTVAQAEALKKERRQKGRDMERFTRMLDSCCDHAKGHGL